MKNLLLYTVCLFTNICGFSQQSDSFKIKLIDSLIDLSFDYDSKEDYSKAIDIISLAAKHSLQFFGKNSIHYFKSISTKTMIYYRHLDYAESEKLYLESINLKVDLSPKFAGVLVNLGNLYYDINEFAKAEHEYLKAKSIFEDSLKNVSHKFYFNCLLNLVRINKQKGDFEKAIDILQKIIQIKENSKNIDETYGFALNSMGLLYGELPDMKRLNYFLKNQSVFWKRLILQKDFHFYTQ